MPYLIQMMWWVILWGKYSVVNRNDMNAVYYCKICFRAFLFLSDIVDHQYDSGHSGVSRIKLEYEDEYFWKHTT